MRFTRWLAGKVPWVARSPARAAAVLTAAARAGDLATQGTFPASHLVNLIDSGIGNLRGKLLLELPGLVQQCAKFVQAPLEQRVLHLDSQPLLVAEAGKRILIVPFISPDLVINDMIGGPRSARITQKQIVFELVDHFAIDAKRIHDDAIFLKFDKIESAEGGSVLVLHPAFNAHVLALNRIGEVRHFVIREG